MVYIGAKVWGKCPFFRDSIFLFLMYDVWLRCVYCAFTSFGTGLRCVFYAARSVPTSARPYICYYIKLLHLYYIAWRVVLVICFSVRFFVGFVINGAADAQDDADEDAIDEYVGTSPADKGEGLPCNGQQVNCDSKVDHGLKEYQHGKAYHQQCGERVRATSGYAPYACQ